MVTMTRLHMSGLRLHVCGSRVGPGPWAGVASKKIELQKKMAQASKNMWKCSQKVNKNFKKKRKGFKKKSGKGSTKLERLQNKSGKASKKNQKTPTRGLHGECWGPIRETFRYCFWYFNICLSAKFVIHIWGWLRPVCSSTSWRHPRAGSHRACTLWSSPCLMNMMSQGWLKYLIY